MADFPNEIENLSFYGGASIDVPELEYNFISFTQDSGFKTCRLVGVFEKFVNKVWDPGGANWVHWETLEADPTGQEYPDPYATGFGACVGYRTTGFIRYRPEATE